jgi:hypothetical protein
MNIPSFRPLTPRPTPGAGARARSSFDDEWANNTVTQRLNGNAYPGARDTDNPFGSNGVQSVELTPNGWGSYDMVVRGRDASGSPITVTGSYNMGTITTNVTRPGW